jgi:transposase
MLLLALEKLLGGVGIMAKQLVSDELWERIEPLLPPEKPRRFCFPGRRPLDRRKILTGIIFVLKTGITWDDLPAELGWGCGRTCRETLAAWQEAGVWQRLHEVLSRIARRPVHRLVAGPGR